MTTISQTQEILSDVDYQNLLNRIDVLMDSDPEPTSTSGKELDLLCRVVENHEKLIYPTV